MGFRTSRRYVGKQTKNKNNNDNYERSAKTVKNENKKTPVIFWRNHQPIFEVLWVFPLEIYKAIYFCWLRCEDDSFLGL